MGVVDRAIMANIKEMLWFVRARAVHNLEQQGHIATGKLSDIEIVVGKVGGVWEGSLMMQDYGIKINEGNFITGDYATMYRWAKIKEPSYPEHLIVQLARRTTRRMAYSAGSYAYSNTGKREGWLNLAIGSNFQVEKALNINGVINELISEFCKRKT